MLMLVAFISGITNPVYNVNQVSLRQAITPDRLQGRMNASMRFIVWGTIPLGALLGGGLGEALGLRPTAAMAKNFDPFPVGCGEIAHVLHNPQDRDIYFLKHGYAFAHHTK